MSDVPELLPARMLNEFAYCPRLFYLEWVQQEFADNPDTVEGRYHHRRADEESGRLPESAAAAQAEEEFLQARSVLLASERLGAIARLDVLEMHDGQVMPIDYKRGQVPADGVFEPERVQLCLQGLLLREHGYRCAEGALYFVESRRRVPVVFDAELQARTLELLAAARATAAAGAIPPPLVDSPKCPRCSLVSICLPDEVNLLRALADPGAAEEDGPAPDTNVRRLLPRRDHALPVYVQAPGLTIGKRGQVLEVRDRQEVLERRRLLDVSQLVIFGNAQVTTQAVYELCGRQIPICFFTGGGWFYGITHGHGNKNVQLRQAQFAAAADPRRALAVARRLVADKIHNSRVFLRRNQKASANDAVSELTALEKKALEAERPESLLGIEGRAGHVYFGHFAALMRREEDNGPLAFDFGGRNRRPPRDPVNAMLSLVYALLVKDWTVTLQAVGLDPYLGFYHRPRFGRPALALDMMEPFRPLLADSVVIGLINNGEIERADFVQRGEAAGIKPAGRRAVLGAYARRLETEVRHPVFDYAISYRRVLEVQARLLGRYLQGELEEPPSFRTR